MVELVETWGSDDGIAKIARLSHGNKGNSTATQLIDLLIRLGHDSVFEFAGATFYVETPIYVQRQWFRHRTASYLERSLRYTKLDNIETEHCRLDDIANRLYSDSVKKSFETYKKLLDAGVPKEVARSVLPLSTKTSFYVSANLRSWFNFLKLRLDKHAQKEIRDEAMQVYTHLSNRFPITMEALNRHRGLLEL